MGARIRPLLWVIVVVTTMIAGFGLARAGGVGDARWLSGRQTDPSRTTRPPKIEASRARLAVIEAFRSMTGKLTWCESGPTMDDREHRISLADRRPGRSNDVARFVRDANYALPQQFMANCWEAMMVAGLKADLVGRNEVVALHERAARAGQWAAAEVERVHTRRERNYSPYFYSPKDAATAYFAVIAEWLSGGVTRPMFAVEPNGRRGPRLVDPSPGDVLLFNKKDPASVLGHVALALGPERMISLDSWGCRETDIPTSFFARIHVAPGPWDLSPEQRITTWPHEDIPLIGQARDTVPFGAALVPPAWTDFGPN